MSFVTSLNRVVFIAVFFLLAVSVVHAEEPNAVAFSGEVKKVILKKNKVAVIDPETKKRFTLIVDEKTILSGWKGLEEIKKGDAISGAYVVTDKGLYVATELKSE
ncbi:MAG: hypothetical protein NPINA01_21150 [Nitrospinaceae bacterium]|nr:MAG: hypothetical protein NPINA01_21150 [Nitrospinaceae bacterium]